MLIEILISFFNSSGKLSQECFPENGIEQEKKYEYTI